MFNRLRFAGKTLFVVGVCTNLSALPDTDGDGIPDYQQSSSATDGQAKVDPMLPVLSLLAAMSLALRRGATMGRGTTMGRSTTTDRRTTLGRRTTMAAQQTIKRGRKAGKGTVALGILIGLLFIGGCSSIPSFGGSDSLRLPTQSISSDQPVQYRDEFSRGLYATAGIGPSRLEPDTSQIPAWSPDDRVEPAAQITIGADLTKHLSLEAHSADLGSAGLSAPALESRGRINYHINGVSALLYAGGNRHRYRRQGLTAFGRVGFGVLENTAVGDVPFEKVNATHVLFGGGVEYMTPIGIGVRAEGFLFDEDVRYAQLALMYRTGKKREFKQPVLAKAQSVVTPAPVVTTPVLAPVAALPDPCEALSGVLEAVTFHTDSADLTSSSKRTLDRVSNTLSSCAATQIEISAHTDSVGAGEYNQSLSEKRAISVATYLSSRGISRNRFSTIAFGETSPIDSNATKQGRARNRRVELYAQ